ncbi:MAG: alginate lyase family protein [Ignavibacteriales bacterium]|nr:alginate lyase family protein [Ignavibacteriales bacterium]
MRSVLIFTTVFSLDVLYAQLSLNPRSRLSDSIYVGQAIKSITDSGLFLAMNLSAKPLRIMKSAVSGGDSPAAYEAWAQYWDSKQKPKYITQNYHMLIDTDMLMDYDGLRTYVRQYPEERDTILRRAAMLLDHKIPAWGDVVLEFGPSIDFNRNVGQSGKYGFHYWIWSRPLNAAAVITGDERYASAFDDMFQQWYDQRNNIDRSIPDFDVVYYELGLGVRNRIFIEYYAIPYSRRNWRTHEKMLKTMLGAARWLYELQLWEGYRSGNWQIHGSYMLTQIALTFPEFHESKTWLQLGLKRLKEHLEQDFFEDGGHSERAPRNYTQATYVAYRNLYYLLKEHRIENQFANEIRRRMSRTIDWWITMLTPTGEVPAINDSHRGLFPVFLLQDAATFYRKPEVYGVLKGLFGLSVPVAQPILPAFTSRNMAASGFAVMRTDWSRDALTMTVNYGKWNGSHTHHDMLDFEVYANGRALAIDAGIGLTYDDPLYIPWYKSSKAHNMVVLNDLNIEREQTIGKEMTWYSSGTIDYLGGEHDGYHFKGVQHRRNIVFVKPSYWVIYDRLTSRNSGDTLSWYLHTPLHLAKTKNGFSTNETPGFKLLVLPTNLQVREGEGMAASTNDGVPGRTQKIPWIAFDQISDSGRPSEFMVVLIPFRENEPDITVSSRGPGHVTITRDALINEVRFNAHHPQGSSPATDAEFFMSQTDQHGQRRFWIVNETFLKESGGVIWKSSSKSSTEGEIRGR